MGPDTRCPAPGPLHASPGLGNAVLLQHHEPWTADGGTLPASALSPPTQDHVRVQQHAWWAQMWHSAPHEWPGSLTSRDPGSAWPSARTGRTGGGDVSLPGDGHRTRNNGDKGI